MGGNGRYRAVTGGMGVGAVAVAAAALYRPLPPAPAHYRPDVHAEYVKYSSAGGATVTAYLAYPERKDRAPGVVVIHEIFGLSDWIRQTTEQLAKDGFVALAPDLLSRRGGTPASSDDARIDGGLPDVAAAVKQAGIDYRYAVYPGVGHGFLRTREKAEVADSAWGAVVRFFRENLEGR